MSSISTVLLLLVVTSIALFVVNLINQRQVRQRLLNQKLAQMKRRVTELEELSATIEPLTENKQIPQIINNEVISTLDSMLKMSPNNNVYRISMENAQMRNDELRDPSRKVSVFRLMESDASLARAHYNISEAARIVRKHQAQERLQVAEMDLILNELVWSDFMVKISSHIAQGHKAMNNDNNLRAVAYYKKALEVASTAALQDDRQNQIISEIGELLNHKRTALSPRLMPETLYNPTPNSAK